MREGPVMSFITGWGMVSALWNIFIALRLFVDHSRIIPSREPDAKKLAEYKEKQHNIGVCGWMVYTLFIRRSLAILAFTEQGSSRT